MIKYQFTTEKSKLDCLVIPLFEDKPFEKTVKQLDEIHLGLFSNAKKLKDFEGKKMQICLLYTSDKLVPRVLLLGLGKQKELNIMGWKQAIGLAVIALQKNKLQKLGFLIPEFVIKKFKAEKIGKETVVAIETANYSFDENKNKEEQIKPIKEVYFSSIEDKNKMKQFEKGIKTGDIIGQCVNYTRYLGNTPPTIMTPTFLAKEAEKLAKEYKQVKSKIINREEMKKLKMGCLLGVARGSREEPKFIIVEYRGSKSKQKPIVLVGKGITFDSGGLSIKTENYMVDMKFDMLGAGVVLGSIKAAAMLGIKKNIIGLIPACENMPGGEAYRPDDILMAMNGKSILVKNTDAEGRIILADALSYASKFKPSQVINFATLTGACMAALGTQRSGLFSEEDRIADKLLKCSVEVGEHLWRLPLGEEYTEEIKSEITDVKNTSDNKYGGASTAAAFLQNFVDYPFAHIDLSSCYTPEKGKPYIRGGANGFGVQTMVEYLI